MATQRGTEPLKRDAISARQRTARAMRVWFKFLIIAFALTIATSSCAPIPCPGGYANPNWCGHGGGGGDGGGA